MQIKVIFVLVLGTIWLPFNSRKCCALAQAAQTYYKIPDPFWATKEDSDGYFSIKSFQCTMTGQRKNTQIEVEEYFSLKFGLTYSLHRNRNDLSQAYAIIGDGLTGKSYIVRNPNVESARELDCELDHLHHHRQVFPWQYVYSSNSSNSGSNSSGGGTTSDTSGSQKKKRDRKNKKNRWSGTRFVYGVGAVWLNAIQRKLVSNEVGDDSPFPSSNKWSMSESDLEIKLLFDKPKEWPEDEAGRELALASTPLGSIQIRRQSTLEQDQELGGTGSVDESVDLITIQWFKRSVKPEEPAMQRFFTQLSECRRSNRKHRVFPSLTRAVSQSPERLYALEYVEQRFGSMKVDEKEMDESSVRVVRDVEVHTEWFSFKLEAQADVYESADDWPNGNGKVPDNYLFDIFLKRHGDHEAQRSTRHSTVHYHFKEMGGQVKSCKVGEADSLPRWFSMMMRQLHVRRADGNTHTCLITGVGALLMNAADTHYKQFSLFQKTINVLYDPIDLKARRKVLVDEWQLYHKDTSRTVHFYFETKKAGSSHDIGDLVRIDVRDAKARADSGELVISEDAGESDDTLVNDMLMRYEILMLDVNKDEDEAKYMFTPPEECKVSVKPDSGGGDTSDDDDDEKEDFHHNEDTFSSDDGSEKTDTEGDNDKQMEGEDFEFEPGKLMESFQFPDLNDFFEAYRGWKRAYNIVYALEIEQDEDDEAKVVFKRIYLMDSVDILANFARHSIFYSRQALDNLKPDLEFYLDYNQELMFRKEGDSCSIVDELDSWMRLLSADLVYHVTKTLNEGENHRSVVTVPSKKLRSYGLGALWRLAAQSEYSYFLGMRKAPIVSTDNCEYKEVSWGLEEDGDSRLLIEFKFMWNATQYNMDSAFGRNRLPNELLHLHSVLFNTFPDSDQETKFEKLKIPDPIRVQSLHPDSLSLPQECADLLKAKSQEEDEAKLKAQQRLPTFWDFVQHTNAYSALYYVSHVQSQTSQSSLSITRIFEHIDRNANMGKLVIGNGPETREVYIDDNRKTMHLFMPETGQCKRVTSLTGLIDIVGDFQEQDIELNAGKMFGLSALWIHLSKLDTMTLTKVYHRPQPSSGKWFEERTYTLTSEPAEGSGAKNSIVYDLVVSFVATTPYSQTEETTFRLENVEFTPRYTNSHSSRPPLHRTSIRVESMNQEAMSNMDLQLPDECSKSAAGDNNNNKPTDGGSGGSGQAQLDFPRLSSFVQATDQFSMRSEITSSLILDPTEGKPDEKRIYIMDEWLYEGDLRVKTYGLTDHDLDVLIFTRTKEAFDISIPYKCARVLPKVFLSGPVTDTSMLDFWAGDRLYVDNLSRLYYGPVSLWRQAELNIGNVKLMNSLNLAPLPGGAATNNLESLEREMRSEVWRMTSPNASNSWTYDMYFERFINQEAKREWHVLEGIRIYNSALTSWDEALNMKRFIEIDVINYRYKHEDREIIDTFMLPEGYGCERDPSVLEEFRKNGDDLNVNWNLEHMMWYEATLELIDHPALEDSQIDLSSERENFLLPTATGLVVKSSIIYKEPQIDLFVHYKRNHFINGTTTSTKIVYDRGSSLVYALNDRTGNCQVGQDEGQVREWSIEFPNGQNQVESIAMDARMMDVLFGQTREYYVPVNRYKLDNFMFSIYEHSVASLPKQTTFRGPATIIRKFQNQIGERFLYRIGGGDTIKLHNSVSTRVLVFDERRERVKAVFNIALRGVSNIDLTQLLQHINIAQCYNNGDTNSDRSMRTFVIEYQCSVRANRATKTRITSTTRDFLVRLFKSTQLLPTQFYGSPRLEFVSDTRFLFAFNLIEAPTAIEYATRRKEGSRISAKLESKCELKQVSDVGECSHWCDRLGCIAMTHCSDRSCRLLTASKLHEGQKLANETLTAKDLLILFASDSDPECSYFVWAGQRPNRLDKLAANLETKINQNLEGNQSSSSSSRSDELSLDLFGSHFEVAYPVRFYQIEDGLESFNEEHEQVADEPDEQEEALVEPASKVSWSDSQTLGQHGTRLVATAIYAVVALIIGTSIQILYTRVAGKSIAFDRRRFL